MEIRVRYAPSPTGNQHIGGIRTALYNYLYARSKGGKFILRLEDTDQTRCEERYTKNLYDSFDWLGFRWDEGPDTGGPHGPYVQSERFDLYKKHAAELVERGHAYYCFCSSERLEEVRREREASKSSETGYDRFCREIPLEEAASRVASGEAHTIRLKIPLGKSTTYTDHVIGKVEWKNEDINSDPVLLKSDGFPTYHLAVIIDDHIMGITHILRAQEWLPSTPIHVILYDSFGWQHPEFCHLPMVMGLDGKKLSKRHGSTSLNEFIEQGYLPQALINYIAMVGASFEEGKEIYSLDELITHFSIDKLSKSPAIFDYKKLEWFNGQYIRMMSDDALAAATLPFAIAQGLFGKPGEKPTGAQEELFKKSMPLVKERVVFLTEIPGKVEYLFKDFVLPPKEEFIPKKADLNQTLDSLKKGKDIVKQLIEAKTDEEAENFIKTYCEKEGLKLGDLMMPLRVAITGSKVSPPLFPSLRLLGEEQTLKRIDSAIMLLEN
ncbi:MAG: glutamate--tRNA ligase [Treponema sp.]|nr:glutamate--tRNA ligase [Treponema sp.]